MDSWAKNIALIALKVLRRHGLIYLREKALFLSTSIVRIVRYTLILNYVIQALTFTVATSFFGTLFILAYQYSEYGLIRITLPLALCLTLFLSLSIALFYTAKESTWNKFFRTEELVDSLLGIQPSSLRSQSVNAELVSQIFEEVLDRKLREFLKERSSAKSTSPQATSQGPQA